MRKGSKNKMASNSKNNHNKQEKVHFKPKLELSDCTCPICLYILIEPVTLPCGHDLCMSCFDTNVKETSLLCPMCRMRIASWARRAARNNKLINQTKWKEIQLAFPKKVQCRLQGIEDGSSSESEQDFVIAPICEPGEIRREYEDELKRLQEECERQRREEEQASERLIAALQAEEFTRQLEQERQTLSDEAMARELSDTQPQTTPLRLSSSSTSTTAGPPTRLTDNKKTPTLLDKFIRKRPGDDTNRNNNSVATATAPTSTTKTDPDPYQYECYSPRDYGKIITSKDATMDHYPYVDEETLRKMKRRNEEGDGNHGDVEEQKGKTEEETLLDFIFIDSREATPASPQYQEIGGLKTEKGVGSGVWGQSEKRAGGNTDNVSGSSKKGKSTLKNWLTSDQVLPYNSKDTQFKGPVATFVSSSAIGPVRRQSDEDNSLGKDSIGPELCHFRPVKTYPKTSPERLPGGGLVKTAIVRSLPISKKLQETVFPTAENLNPATLGNSPVIQRHLLELQAERQLQVSLQSKATSTSTVGLATKPKCLPRRVDLGHKVKPANGDLEETITKETASFSVPREVIKPSKPATTGTSSSSTKSTATAVKSPVQPPDSTVVIDDSDSNSSDVQLIEEVPPPMDLSALHTHMDQQPLLPILPLDPHLHDNQYPQLDYEEDDDTSCLHTFTEKSADHFETVSKSETTTSSSIIALLDTGQATTKESTSGGPHQEPLYMLSETTRSDAANLSLLGGYKGWDLTSSSLFGVGTKGAVDDDGNPVVVAKAHEEPRLTSFSNVITPIKCRRGSSNNNSLAEDLKLDNYSRAQIRGEEESLLDKQEEDKGSEHNGDSSSSSSNSSSRDDDSGLVTKGSLLLHVVVPSDDSVPVSSTVQSSPRSKVYRMKRSLKTNNNTTNTSKATSSCVLNIDLTRSPAKTTRSSEGQAEKDCSGSHLMSKVDLLKMDLDVPVMSPEVGVQQWLQNSHTYITEESSNHGNAPAGEGDEDAQAEKKLEQGREEVSDMGKAYSPKVEGNAIEMDSKSLDANTDGNIVEKLAKLCKKKQSDCLATSSGGNRIDGAKSVVECGSSLLNTDKTVTVDHSYSKCLIQEDQMKISPQKTQTGAAHLNRDAKVEDRVCRMIEKEQEETSSQNAGSSRQNVVNQTLTRVGTGTFTVHRELSTGTGHSSNTTGAAEMTWMMEKKKGFPEVIRSVCNNATMSVVGASDVYREIKEGSEPTMGVNTSWMKRTLDHKKDSEAGEDFVDCSPAKKQKVLSGEKNKNKRCPLKKALVSHDRFRTSSNHGDASVDHSDGISCDILLDIDVGESTGKGLKKTGDSKGSIIHRQGEVNNTDGDDDTVAREMCVCNASQKKDRLFTLCRCGLAEPKKNVEVNKFIYHWSLSDPAIVEQKGKVETGARTLGRRPSEVSQKDRNNDGTNVKVGSEQSIKVVGQGIRQRSSNSGGQESNERPVVHKPPLACRGRKRKVTQERREGSESEGIVGTTRRKRGRPCKKIVQSNTKIGEESSKKQTPQTPNTVCDVSAAESDEETQSISNRTRSKTPTKPHIFTPTKSLYSSTPCKPHRQRMSSKPSDRQKTPHKDNIGESTEMIDSICTRTRSKTPTKSHIFTPTKALYSSTDGKTQGQLTSRIPFGRVKTPHKETTVSGNICTRTRSTPVKMGEVTPSKVKQKGATPSKALIKGITPGKGLTKGGTPSKGKYQGVTPSKRLTKGVTPSKDSTKGATPSKSSTKGVTPSKASTKGVTPSKVLTKGVTPSKGSAKGVGPKMGSRKEVTPWKALYKVVTPSKVTKGVPPNATKVSQKMVTPDKAPNKGITPVELTEPKLSTSGNISEGSKKVGKWSTPKKTSSRSSRSQTPCKVSSQNTSPSSKAAGSSCRGKKLKSEENVCKVETEQVEVKGCRTAVNKGRSSTVNKSKSSTSHNKTVGDLYKGNETLSNTLLRSHKKSAVSINSEVEELRTENGLKKTITESVEKIKGSGSYCKVAKDTSVSKRTGRVSKRSSRVLNTLAEDAITGGDLSGADDVFCSDVESESETESICSSKTRAINPRTVTEQVKRVVGKRRKQNNSGAEKVSIDSLGSHSMSNRVTKKQNKPELSSSNRSGGSKSINTSDPLFSESEDEGINSKQEVVLCNTKSKEGKPQSGRNIKRLQTGDEVLGDNRGTNSPPPVKARQKKIVQGKLDQESDRNVTGVLKASVEYTPTDLGKKKKRKVIRGKRQELVQKKVGGGVKGGRNGPRTKDVKKTTQTTLVFMGHNSEDEFEENVQKVKKVLSFSAKQKSTAEAGATAASVRVNNVGLNRERDDAVVSSCLSRTVTSTGHEKDSCGNSNRSKTSESDSKQLKEKTNLKACAKKSSNVVKKSKSTTQSCVMSEVIIPRAKSVSDYYVSKPSWYGLDSPRKPADHFRTRVEYECYIEEQDRLMALKLQADFDMEAKFHLTAIRRKGSNDEYKLREKRRRTQNR